MAKEVSILGLGTAIAKLDRYSGTDTDYQEVVSWTVPTGKSSVLYEVSFVTNKFDKTQFRLQFRKSLSGRLTFTNGSTAVTGSGTAFTTELEVGDKIILDADEVWAEVDSIGSDTSLTLTEAYTAAAAMQGAVADDGGAQTDETTEANNDTANDMTLLPAAPAVDDAYYFGGVYPFQRLTINIGTKGVKAPGSWTLIWEYWNGSAWATLTVTDNTNEFTVAGMSDVTFTRPVNWVATAVATITAYWIRARVTAATAPIGAQPKGTQSWLTSGSKVWGLEDKYIQAALSLKWEDNKLAGGTEIKLEAKSSVKLEGTIVGGPFTVGETATGSVSGASGTVIEQGADYITLGDITGTFVAGDTVTGTDSGASINGTLTITSIAIVVDGSITGKTLEYE